MDLRYGPRRPLCVERDQGERQRVGCVWTAPLVQGLVEKKSDLVRLRACVRPVLRGARPLAQMGSAIHSQTDA